MCEEFLLEGLDIDNVLSLMRLADLHEAINLRNACVEFAAINYDTITTHPEAKVCHLFSHIQKANRHGDHKTIG